MISFSFYQWGQGNTTSSNYEHPFEASALLNMKFHMCGREFFRERELGGVCPLSPRRFIQTHTSSLTGQGSGPHTGGTREPPWPCLAVAKEERDSQSSRQECKHWKPPPQHPAGLKGPITPREENTSAQFSTPCTPDAAPLSQAEGVGDLPHLPIHRL